MALTTLAAVKAFKSITDTSQDAEIGRLITVVSEYLTRYCRRTFDLNATLVEYHSGTSGQATLLLDRPPINSIASIYDDPERAYGASTLIAAADYVIEDAVAGLVRLDGASFQEGLRNVKVTYSGGFAVIPAGLEQAAIQLVWLARDKGQYQLLGQSAKSIGDGSITLLNNNWPAHLAPMLDLYVLVDR